MPRDRIRDEYFDWIYNLVCGVRSSDKITYVKLLSFLHNTVFKYSIEKDGNRAQDGISLRRRFTFLYDDPEQVELYLYGPCSVLEMMTALSIRCEEEIMDDPDKGDRTGQWFWGMVVSLGLGSMDDARFDIGYAEKVINTFLSRNYKPNGKGGLFTLRHCDTDLRDVEIWYQLCWYLDEIA